MSFSEGLQNKRSFARTVNIAKLILMISLATFTASIATAVDTISPLPSQLARANGFKFLIRSLPTQYLEPSIQPGRLMVTGTAAELENMNIDVMDMDSEEAQRGRIYFELVAEHQLLSKTLPTDNSIVLVFDLETLDRSDYHISSGWPFGYYTSAFGTPENPESNRFYSSAEPVSTNEKLLPADAALTLRYAEMAKVISTYGFKALGGTQFADTAKDFMARVNKYGWETSPVIKETISLLRKENPAQDWTQLLAQSFDPLKFQAEQNKFIELLAKISNQSKTKSQEVGTQNEVVFRNSVSLQYLRTIIVPPTKRDALLKKLKGLGDPANFQLKVDRWSDLLVIADAYSQLSRATVKSCRSVLGN